MLVPTAKSASLGALTVLLVAWSGTAAADVQHTVARGHTIEAIAHRYHVTAKAIVDANHLKDPRHLKVGETLIIPGVTAAKAGSVTGKGGKAGGPVSYA